MKIFILLLALGLCLADAVPGGYQPIDTTEAQADPTIQSYIQTGLNAVVQNAIKKGFFSNSDFTLASINSVAEQVVNGANYKFDCNFTDSTGIVIQANFVIHQSATTNATTVTSAKVLGAAYKTLKNGELYKFTAEASNGDNVDLELGFEVSLKVPAYTYKVKVTTTVPTNNTSGDNSTTPVDTGAGSGSDNNTTIPVDNGSGSDNNTTTPVDTGSGSDNNSTTPVDNGSGSDNNSTTPVDNGSGSDNNSTTPVDSGSGSDNNSTTPVDTNTTSPSADQWIVIDPAQVQQSAELQSNLAQGFNQVIQTVVQKKLLAADNYTVTQVVAISYHNLTKGVNYKFTVKANNDAQTFFLDMNFTTYYRYSNQSVKTVAYHYNYYTKAAPAGQNTTSNNTAPAGQNTTSNNTAPAQNNTTPAQNTTTPTQNTTTPTQNNTTPAQNTTNSTNGYVALSADEIQAQDVQNAINYGSNQVVQIGIQKGKIPSDTYNITQVASVFKKIQPSGANYNATVTLKSAANVTVNTNFNVYYNSTSNAMILKAYSYGVTGIKKNN